MKKILLVFVCALFISFQSNAQAGFRLGLKGGLNFANLNIDEGAGEAYDSRTGYHIGAFATIKLAKLAIQPEIIYSVQGSNYSFEIPGFTSFDDVRQDFSYLNIPVMVKLYLIGGLNLQAGPQFGFLLGAESEDDIIEDLTETDDLKDTLKGSDVSIGLGAGWDLPFGLTVDARYNLGLTDVNDTSVREEARNQVFQLSVGYRLINLGK
ncbi:MAG: porin family protein [Bacteroidota bacterium]